MLKNEKKNRNSEQSEKNLPNPLSQQAQKVKSKWNVNSQIPRRIFIDGNLKGKLVQRDQGGV